MKQERSSPVAAQIPLSPEMVLTAAREVVTHLHSLGKPYSAGVVADCMLTIENLLSRAPDTPRPEAAASCGRHGGNCVCQQAGECIHT